MTEAKKILRLEDIVPNVFALKAQPVDFRVRGLVARGTVNQQYGIGGSCKSALAQKMAVALALGTTFLGRECQRTPVLYLDYENTLASVQRRLGLLAKGPVDGLHYWGTWCKTWPPKIGNPVLLEIASNWKPFVVIDPFLYAHDADENSSKEMRPIMQCLREYASAGATVWLVHHATKTGGSRGTTAIMAAVDCEFSQEMDDFGMITITSGKSRDIPKQKLSSQGRLRGMGIHCGRECGRRATESRPGAAAADHRGPSRVYAECSLRQVREEESERHQLAKSGPHRRSVGSEETGKFALYFLPGAPEQDELYTAAERSID